MVIYYPASIRSTKVPLYQGTVADGAPVVLISAQLKYNIDVVCEYIVKKIPIPERNFVQPPNMIVIRSFDVNKPGYEVDEKRGGVAGGSILRVCFILGFGLPCGRWLIFFGCRPLLHLYLVVLFGLGYCRVF